MSTVLNSDNSQDDERLLKTEEAARYLSVSTAFLERDRWAGARQGRGPLIPYVRVGQRAVRYRVVDLRRHVDANRCCSHTA